MDHPCEARKPHQYDSDSQSKHTGQSQRPSSTTHVGLLHAVQPYAEQTGELGFQGYFLLQNLLTRVWTLM